MATDLISRGMASKALKQYNDIETNLSKVEEMMEESIKTIEELNRYTRAFPFPPHKAFISIRFDDNDASIY